MDIMCVYLSVYVCIYIYMLLSRTLSHDIFLIARRLVGIENSEAFFPWYLPVSVVEKEKKMYSRER